MIEPQTRCERPGCKNWAEPLSKTCKEHQQQYKKQRDALRNRWQGNAADRGYDSVWSNLSAIVRKEEPLCKRCLERGILKDTDVTDHIVPIVVRPDLRLVRSNLQGLCYACNSEKMVEDMKKYPTFYTKQDNKTDRIDPRSKQLETR